MWVDVEESEFTYQFTKFLRFRAREFKDVEWLKNEFGGVWGCSTVYHLPGIKYEVIEFLENEDAYVLRYWKGGDDED